ncbi:pimeloyl-ACP methyl ester carboxylesterase [Mycolicibacterium mucogenicum 261Sha1.1M5]|nr:pimeloyl-ACP methyl ester carboxylesterase [Mycolicibacterium mucogenicum 261Sha1.1M5]
MLFLHGGGVSGWMWRPVVAQLAGTVRSIVPDLPGHGTSSSVEYTSHDDAVDRLVALIRDRAQNGVTVVGFSLGAQLALRLAADYPSLVRAALIISGETVPAPAQAATLALLRASAPLARREWFARLQAKQLGVPETLLERYIEDSRAMTTDTLVASVRENIGFTLPEGWRRFTGPAAVVVGARERGLMRKSADLTHEALPHSSLVVVPDAAHDAPLTRPDRIADEVRRLLAQAEAGRTGSDAS